MMGVSGKRVLVTGGAVRVGAAICRAFASAGAEVVIHCSKSREHAEKLLEEIGGNAKHHTIVQGQFSDEESVKKMIEQAGPLDFLINSAASYDCKKLTEETAAAMEKQFFTNFFAPSILMREFAKNARPDACIINIVDQAISSVSSGSFSYSISKQALAHATKAAAIQLAPAIRVNAIAPGPVIAPESLAHLNMQKTLSSIPLHRKVDLNDLTDAVLFLCGNRSITGTILYVDCGQSLL